MNQALYAHMNNKRKMEKKSIMSENECFSHLKTVTDGM
jgi:hypothetical protein